MMKSETKCNFIYNFVKICVKFPQNELFTSTIIFLPLCLCKQKQYYTKIQVVPGYTMCKF